MDESKKSYYLEQLTKLTFDYTYLLKVDSDDKIIPEIIVGSFENITGYSLDEIREKNFFLSIIYDEDLFTFLDYWGKIISGKTDTIITRLLTKKNEIKWVKIYSKPIIDDSSQNISMILGAVQDITEQKLMEEVLRESERTYRTLIESMGEGIILSDNNDHIIYVNKKFTEMLDYSKNEIIGKVGYNIFVEEGKRSLIVDKKQLRESGISDSYETELQHKNGSHINVNISGSPLMNEKAQVIGTIGIVNDISEHKKNINKIKKQNEEISTLYRAGKLLSQKLDVTSVFNTVFDIISEIVEFSELFVARYNSNDKMIKYIYMKSVKSDEHLDVSVVPEIPLAPEGYGILSDVIRNAKSIILNDYQDSFKKTKTFFSVKVAGKEYDDNSREDVTVPQSAIVMPIMLEEEVLGVVQLYTETKNAYNEEQLSFLEAFLQQVSLAYKNAILYQKAQDEIKERIEAEKYLTEALNEREILLKEIYHRVKNNLQLVASLLKMQSAKIKDPLIRKYFLESKDKVTAISLIHDKLYKMRDLSRIDFADYIYTLVDNLKGMHSLSSSVDINVTAQKLYLSIDIAMPCGLILNELITNALKHAFDDSSKNPKIEISFSMNRDLNKYNLIIKDNGKGFPADIDYQNSNSLGIKLINTLVKQVDGTLQLIKDKGSVIMIDFPPSSYSRRI